MHIYFVCDELKPTEVGQGDLIFVLRSGYINRSVHAILQVGYLCARLRFVSRPPWLTSRQTPFVCSLCE